MTVSLCCWTFFARTSSAWIAARTGSSDNNPHSKSFQRFRSSIMEASPSSTSGVSSSGTSAAIPLPRLPIPDPICSDVPDTWAHDTMSRRVNEEILERTVRDCAGDLARPEFAAIRRSVEALRAELSAAAATGLTHLDRAKAPSDKEWREWHEILEPHVAKGDTWLTAPWMVTEFYVYRRLMQCFGYWTEDSAGYMYDPFRKQKQAGLVSSVGSSEPALARIAGLPVDSDEGLQLAVSLALWYVTFSALLLAQKCNEVSKECI